MKDLYFSHDRNAMFDNRISELRGVYRMEGYGVYWGIIEALSREPDLTLPLAERKIKALYESMRPSFDMSEFINTCIDIGLFKTDGERFWSDSLRRRMKEAAERAEISRKRSEAAKQRWRILNAGKEAAEAKGAPERPKKADAAVDVDQEWRRVVEAYESEIGMMPFGSAVDTLASYYDDLGADAMIVAIHRTNEAQPDVPYKFLKAILESFVKAGVKSGADAEACCLDFDRKTKGKRATDEKGEAEQRRDEDVRWLD